jgi:hypothetical protein
MRTNLHHLLEQMAHQRSRSPAPTFRDLTMSYAELWRTTRLAAQGLPAIFGTSAVHGLLNDKSRSFALAARRMLVDHPTDLEISRLCWGCFRSMSACADREPARGACV